MVRASLVSLCVGIFCAPAAHAVGDGGFDTGRVFDTGGHLSLLQVRARETSVVASSARPAHSGPVEFTDAYRSFVSAHEDFPPELDGATEEQLLDLMRMYRPCAVCENAVHIGVQMDGGYIMCGDGMQGIKGLYSLGIHNEDSFGDDLSSRLNVTAYQYDCFDRRAPQCTKPGCNFEFNAVCIGAHQSSSPCVVKDEQVCGDGNDACQRNGQSSTLEFDTLINQMTAHGHSEPRTPNGDLLMEMDIEGSEWETLADPAVVPFLKQFQQLVIEFHWIGTSKYPIDMQLGAMRNVLQDFVIVHTHGNNCCPELQVQEFHMPYIFEVTFVNRAALPAGACDANPKQVGDKNMPWKSDVRDAHLPGDAQES